MRLATEYLEKALIMTHPQSGLLAVHNKCLQLRLTTLSTIACCMCLSGKPNLGLKYAHTALSLLRNAPHAASGEAEVCHATMSDVSLSTMHHETWWLHGAPWHCWLLLVNKEQSQPINPKQTLRALVKASVTPKSDTQVQDTTDHASQHTGIVSNISCYSVHLLLAAHCRWHTAKFC
jgi:hypothetical protein